MSGYTRLNPEYQRKGSSLEFISSLATGDFNNLTTRGIYYTQNGMTANKPTTGSIYGYIIVLYISVVTIQLVITSSGPTMYLRAYAGNPPSWGSWRTI